MKSTVIISLVVLAIIGGLVYMSMSKKPDGTMEASKQSATAPSDTTITTGSETAKGDAMTAEKTVTVEGSNFKFVPDTITVKKGEKTKIVFKDMQGMHDFNVDELGIKTNVLQTGAEQTVEFTADKAGTFEFYCSVGQHRQMGMKGTLIVEE